MTTSVTTAVDFLRAGRAVAVPTETVYGLAADATNPLAVAEIFALKGRPAHNPLIVHVPDAAMAQRYIQWSASAAELAQRYWPGALSLLGWATPAHDLAAAVTAGLPTVVVRVPRHPLLQEILRALNKPVAAPSANPSGLPSPTKAAHVQAQLGKRVAYILDGGACEHGLESTILDLTTTPPSLLRHGAISSEVLESFLGISLQHDQLSNRAPGQLLRHYAPRARLRLQATSVNNDEALLAFGTPLTNAGHCYQLSASGDVAEAARRLYDGLLTLDASGVATIAVMPIPAVGLGRSINDRLHRAARAQSAAL